MKKIEYKPISFEGLLQILFIYLKLTNQIDWNWFLVLLPYILYIVVSIIITIILAYKEVKEEYYKEK